MGFKIIKYLFLFLVLFAFINIAPHLWVRLNADANAVKVFEGEHSISEFAGALKLVTYNIAHGRGGVYGAKNWNGESEQVREHRLNAIASFLKQVDADVVVLNELDFNCDWSFNQNQAAYIAKKSGYPFWVEQRNYDLFHPFFRLQFGNAVLSKYPIKSASLLKFEPMSKLEDWFFGNHNGAIVNVQLDENIEASIAALHLEVRDRDSRLKTFSVLKGLIENTKVPTILAGDLNSEKSKKGNAESAIDKLVSILGVEHYPDEEDDGLNYTFPSERPARTLDWVLVPSSANILDGSVHNVLWSDHLPVVTSIELQ